MIQAAQIEELLQSMIQKQQQKVLNVANSILPNVTHEDIRNPQDFPALFDDAVFNYEDGILTGYLSVQMALRSYFSKGKIMKPKRILVIEDQVDYRFLLQQNLENAGYDVDVAGTVDEGITKFYQAPHDLVITDMLFPNGQQAGTAVVLKIKEDFPHAKIIAISAETQTLGVSYLESAAEFGANRILYKPIQPEVMLDAVKTLLDEPI